MPDIFTDNHKNQTPEEKPHNHDAVLSVQKLMHREQHTIGLFNTFSFRPQGISFANQEPDEKILLFLRRHFITNLPWIIWTFLLFLFPPLFFVTAPYANISISTVPLGLTVSLTAFYYLIVIGYAFSHFISWFYNIGIVTQKRIIDLDSTNILSHNSATANYNEIVDVKFTQRGFLQSFFNYGDIHIQTEAVNANFEFLAAPHPTQASDVISDLRSAFGHAQK